MSTRHVILALLDIKPMSGYDLFQSMKISLNSLWAATYSQIYPALHKMEDEGLVHGTTKMSKKNREKIVYSLTNSGKKELLDWFEEEITYLPFRDPFKLWATNIDRCSRETIKKNIDRHIQLNSERKAEFEAIVQGILDESHPLIKERIRTVPPERVEQIKKSRALVFSFLAEQAEFEIRCAKKVRELAVQLTVDR